MPDAASTFWGGKGQASDGGSIGGLANAKKFIRLKMLSNERMAGLVKLHRGGRPGTERQARAEDEKSEGFDLGALRQDRFWWTL